MKTMGLTHIMPEQMRQSKEKNWPRDFFTDQRTWEEQEMFFILMEPHSLKVGELNMNHGPFREEMSLMKSLSKLMWLNVLQYYWIT